MKRVQEDCWVRVQARRARRIYLAGGEVGISGPGQHADEALWVRDGAEATAEGWEDMHFALWHDECMDTRPFRLWYWATLSAKWTIGARPRNHAPREKAELAQRINTFYIAQGTGAVIAGERLQDIPRRLLRQL